jgi:hypothetical protein
MGNLVRLFSVLTSDFAAGTVCSACPSDSYSEAAGTINMQIQSTTVTYSLIRISNIVEFHIQSIQIICLAVICLAVCFIHQ